MSLTGATYFARARLGNVQESYLVDIYDSDGNVAIRLGQQDVKWTDGHYYGAIVVPPEIRSEIDLVKCTSAIASVSIEVLNIPLGGSLVSGAQRLLGDILLNGTGGGNNFLSWQVVIYSWLGPEVNADLRLEIFRGRLMDVIPKRDGLLALELEEKRPWDLLNIPNVKSTSANGLYFPVVYGAYTPNSTKPNALAYSESRDLWPGLVDTVLSDGLRVLLPKSYSTDEVRPHFYEPGSDDYIPLVDSSNNYLAASTSLYGGNVAVVDPGLIHGWKYKPVDHSSHLTYTFTLTNPANSYDTHTADEAVTYANASVTGTACTIYYSIPQPVLDVYDTNASAVQFTIDLLLYWDRGAAPSGNLLLVGPGGTIQTYTPNFASLPLTETKTWTITNTDLPGGVFPATFGFQITGGSVAFPITVRFYDVRVKMITRTNPGTDASSMRLAKEKLEAVDRLFFGADGLGASGGFQAAVADQIHEAHRDMLYRYAGLTATPDGWTAINTARANWDVRFWIHEPEPLIDVLERLQYEGCFVFHVRPNGTGTYIAVKSSYSSGDVAATLDVAQDCSGLGISLTHIKDLVTKYEVDFHRHPAIDGRYIDRQTATSASRSDYSFASTENIERVTLDYLVTTESDDSSDVSGWTDYRELVSGAIKTLVSVTVLNPRYFFLEVGDIAKFSNVTQAQDTFGTLTLKYYMIIKTARSPGKLKLDLREVG